MLVQLRYGAGSLPVEIPSGRVSVIEPAFVPGLADEAGAFRQAARAPIGARPLRDVIGADQRLAQILLKARVALFSELDPAGAWRRKCGAGAPTPRLRSSPKGR